MPARRNFIRLLLFALFAALAFGGLPEGWHVGSLVLPALSPLLSLGGAVAAWTAGLSALLALPLLILPFFKGRFFCWRLCPMGFASETASRLNKRGAGLVRRIPFLGKPLALAVIASAAAGCPVLLWTDPLCVFNGFFAAWRLPLTLASCATATGFVLIILASLLVPNVWCHRLCPLGGLQEMLMRLGLRLRAASVAHALGAETPSLADNVRVGRRVFLGFAAGGVAGLAYGRASRGRAAPAALIRPPGAAETAFNALCSRCGNCMAACPYDLIVPDLGLSGADGLFTPVLKFRSQNPRQEQFCFQECAACTQVCPTGALRPLSVEQKQCAAIGVARVCKTKCIAWEKGEYCVVCQEFCPYQAVIEVKHKGVNCPVIDEKLCRGCGACESQCPAEPIAIIVENRRSPSGKEAGRNRNGPDGSGPRRRRLRGASPSER